MEQVSQTRWFAWPSAEEWWSALRWVLLTFTLLVALSLAGSFYSYERVVAEGHPWLPHFHCSGCPFCGMTRAFCALSSGQLREAISWNRSAPALYGFFWLWLTVALTYLFKTLRRIAHQRTLQNGAKVLHSWLIRPRRRAGIS